MKYIDLTAVEDIEAKEMAAVLGGAVSNFGLSVPSVVTPGGGINNLVGTILPWTGTVLASVNDFGQTVVLASPDFQLSFNPGMGG